MKSSVIVSKCLEYYLAYMNTYYIENQIILISIVFLGANFVKFSIGFGVFPK